LANQRLLARLIRERPVFVNLGLYEKTTAHKQWWMAAQLAFYTRFGRFTVEIDGAWLIHGAYGDRAKRARPAVNS
jgi:hypothetical protein